MKIYMSERAIDNIVRFRHNRFKMAESSNPESGLLHLPPNKDLRFSPTRRRGFLSGIGKVVAIATGAIGAAWGGSKLLETAIDKDQRVQDAQIKAHEQQIQSQTNIERLPPSK